MRVRFTKNTLFKVSNKKGWIVSRGQKGSSVVLVEEQSIPFCSCLSYEWQDITAVVKKIMASYINVSYEIVKNDAEEFYYNLSKLGMVETSENTNSQNKQITSEIEKRTLEDDNKELVSLRDVHFDLTNRCNERCVHCYIPHQIKNKDMDDFVLNIILKEIENSSSVMSVSVSGGEPMLHPRFVEVIKSYKHIRYF